MIDNNEIQATKDLLTKRVEEKYAAGPEFCGHILKVIEYLEAQVEDLDRVNDGLREERLKLTLESAKQDGIIEDRDDEIRELQVKVEKLAREVSSLLDDIDEKDGEIAALNSTIEDLETQLNGS